MSSGDVSEQEEELGFGREYNPEKRLSGYLRPVKKFHEFLNYLGGKKRGTERREIKERHDFYRIIYKL